MEQEEAAVPGVGEALRSFMEVRIFGDQSVVTENFFRFLLMPFLDGKI
jgi:hypothetical protein